MVRHEKSICYPRCQCRPSRNLVLSFENSEPSADRVIDEITGKYDLLCEFPQMGRRRAELGANYRSLPLGNYVIFYRGLETKLEISRVLHGSRNIWDLFTPEEEE